MSTDTQSVLRACITVIREPAVTPMSPRRREICWNFGFPAREPPTVLADNVPIQLGPGSILLLTGPSGSGKTSLLHALAETCPRRTHIERLRISSNRAIVDAIAPRRPLATALEILTACGLGEPRLWLRRFDDLSDGEQVRARLARAIGDCMDAATPAPIFADEFTAVLHRRAARAIAHNLRRLVTRHRLILILATAHHDIVEDLQPDQRLCLGGESPDLVTRPTRERAISLRRRASIEPGSARDYHLFSPMHYRHHDGLGFVDKVFLLKEQPRGEPLGILVFAHAPMELSLRNVATGGRFSKNLRRLNRELRILRRLVIHPDVRGCGLGHWFVRQTLPRVGVRFIECLAAMGSVNPVFERAGMRLVGRCPVPIGRMKLLTRLADWKLDPFAPDFPERIARLPRVRSLVLETIQDWVDATHGRKPYRLSGRRSQNLARTFRQIIGEPPLYYLWDRDSEFPRPGNAGTGHRASDDLFRPRPRRRPYSGGRAADRHHPDP